MKEIIESIVKKIVDKPEKVSVEESKPNDHTMEFKIKVDKSDLGKVIGKKGKNINAIRTITIAMGAKDHHRISLQFVE